MQTQAIGEWKGVSLQVVAWDGAGAAVDLSAACMFERELGADGPAGGLQHLDGALEGALTTLRSRAIFRAEPMETLLVRTPPATIAAREILLIGLGQPTAWTAEVSARAASTAVHCAVRRGAASAAFAPSIKDAGLTAGSGAGLQAALLDAVIHALNAEESLVDLGLSPPLSLRQWTFDAGAANFEAAAKGFQSAFAAWRN